MHIFAGVNTSFRWPFSPPSFWGVIERVWSVNCSRPFFRAGAYTESDNALRLKKMSGNARLVTKYVAKEIVIHVQKSHFVTKVLN